MEAVIYEALAERRGLAPTNVTLVYVRDVLGNAFSPDLLCE